MAVLAGVIGEAGAVGGAGAGVGAVSCADVASSPEQSSGESEIGEKVSRQRNGSMFGCGPSRAVALRICWVGASRMVGRRRVVRVVVVVVGGRCGVKTGGGR